MLPLCLREVSRGDAMAKPIGEIATPVIGTRLNRHICLRKGTFFSYPPSSASISVFRTGRCLMTIPQRFLLRWNRIREKLFKFNKKLI